MMVIWSRNSNLGPARIASFVCLVLFKDGGCRVSVNFIFLFPMFLFLIKEIKTEVQ